MTDSIFKNSIKMIFVGQSGVGKTSIITRKTKNIFKEDLPSSDGGSYSEVKVRVPEHNNEILTIHVWDTAGQEKYLSLANLFFKDVKICALVYDISQKSSFEALKNIWHGKALKYGGNEIGIIFK